MSVQIAPLHNWVLISRLHEVETAKGGIIIPDTAKEKSQKDEVIAVGAGNLEKRNHVPMNVNPAQEIVRCHCCRLRCCLIDLRRHFDILNIGSRFSGKIACRSDCGRRILC